MAELGGRLLGERVVALRSLGGGCLFDVRAADLADGRRVVVKSGARGIPGQLAIEARMLGDLAAAGVPVPRVLDAGENELVLEWVDHDGGSLDSAGRAALARDVARLHAQPRPSFGYAYDTVIGALPQPNPRADRWITFFRQERLAGPAQAARREGALDAGLHGRLDALADRLDELLDEPPHPSLLHGDLWSGNVLANRGRMVALIDPAIYHGHPEIELAFALLFGPFEQASLAAYMNERPLAPGFEPTRRAIYQLYPLLVHLRLFGRSYASPIADRLDLLRI